MNIFNRKSKMAKKDETPKTEPVISLVEYYPRLHQTLHAKLLYADLLDDAVELMAIIEDSPRYKKRMCAVAERRVEQKREEIEKKRKELEEAERAVKAYCYIGGQ